MTLAEICDLVNADPSFLCRVCDKHAIVTDLSGNTLTPESPDVDWIQDNLADHDVNTEYIDGELTVVME